MLPLEELVEPEPVPIEPEPVPIAPDPVPIEPEPVPIEPEPVPIEPVPVPDMVPVVPEFIVSGMPGVVNVELLLVPAPVVPVEPFACDPDVPPPCWLWLRF